MWTVVIEKYLIKTTLGILNIKTHDFFRQESSIISHSCKTLLKYLSCPLFTVERLVNIAPISHKRSVKFYSQDNTEKKLFSVGILLESNYVMNWVNWD